MDKIRNFFWLCSGANRKILEDTPTEASKYVGIGATVFFTGIFAMLAGFYAFYSVFQNLWVAWIAGLVWGAMIFNLDRYIVSSMRKSNSSAQEFKMALPRIILAIMIAIVISKPLEMRIFDKEIEAEITLMEQEFEIEKESLIKSRFVPSIDSLHRDIARLKSEISQKTLSRDNLNIIAQLEADGTGGSLRRNAGPIYRIKKADADRVDHELQELMATNNQLIGEKQSQISEVEKLMSQEIQSRKESSLNGLASRMEALSRITSSSSAIWIANWFIILLFVAIETAPVLVKLISNRGPYDYRLQTIEYNFKAENIEALARSNVRVKKRAEKMSKMEQEFVTDQLNMGLNQA